MYRFSELHPKIRTLRQNGYTYNEIQDELGIEIPKSTLSSICKNIEMTKTYHNKIESLNAHNLKEARKKALAVNKHKRDKYLSEITDRTSKLVKNLDISTLKIALAMLYWGEGAKWKGHSGLMLGSSDPLIITTYINLLKQCYSIDVTRLRCRISHRHDQDINQLTKYWSNLTNIPLDNFYKTKPDPRTKGKKTRSTDYQGVCVIVCTGSTEIQLELQTIAEHFHDYMGH